MKTAINTQSQNEVKDLLNEYVVSPLNADISTTLSKMSTEIESLEESTKADIGKVSTSINGNISRLQRLLDYSFHFNEEDDVFENLSDTIINSQESIIKKVDDSQKELSNIYDEIKTVLVQMEVDFKRFDNLISCVAEKNKLELIGNIFIHFEKLEKLLKMFQSTSNASTNEIKSKLSNYQISISSELSSLSTQIKESYEQSEKQLSDIHSSLTDKLQEIENLIIKNNDGLTENLNTQLQTISDNYTEQSAAISKYREDNNTAINSIVSQQKSLIEQKYKTLLAVSLSFGIVNAVGFITIILLFLMK